MADRTLGVQLGAVVCVFAGLLTLMGAGLIADDRQASTLAWAGVALVALGVAGLR